MTTLIYDVIKYNRRTEAVSFIQCPGFDIEPEPSLASVVTVRSDGTLQRRAVPSDPLIYHHKWLFVDDDYPGFDVAESQRRSAAWLALPAVDKSRIGRRSYWETHVVPRLTAVTGLPEAVREYLARDDLVLRSLLRQIESTPDSIARPHRAGPRHRRIAPRL